MDIEQDGDAVTLRRENGVHVMNALGGETGKRYSVRSHETKACERTGALVEKKHGQDRFDRFGLYEFCDLWLRHDISETEDNKSSRVRRVETGCG